MYIYIYTILKFKPLTCVSVLLFEHIETVARYMVLKICENFRKQNRFQSKTQRGSTRRTAAIYSECVHSIVVIRLLTRFL